MAGLQSRDGARNASPRVTPGVTGMRPATQGQRVGTKRRTDFQNHLYDSLPQASHEFALSCSLLFWPG